MPLERIIDSKYKIVVVEETKINIDDKTQEKPVNKIKIVNSINGNEIPEDEPLFLLRAKDILSLTTLMYYYTICQADKCTTEQLQSLLKLIRNWAEWQGNNRNILKQPGSTMPEDLANQREKILPSEY